MSETDPLLGEKGKEKETLLLEKWVTSQIHAIALDELFNAYKTTWDGLTTENVKSKRDRFGLNYVTPPIQLPAIFCCCLLLINLNAKMRKYYQCVPRHGLVKRNGKWLYLDALSIVPGDIIRVAKHDLVPADIRIIQADSCGFDVSYIMGKDMKVKVDIEKQVKTFLDSPNIALLGYRCVEGECLGVVLYTGDGTFLAHIMSQGQWPPPIA